MPNPLIDITGHVFGRLKVISRSQLKSGGNTMWRVRCLDCGMVKNVQRGSLLRLKGTGCKCDTRNKTGDLLVGKVIDKMTIVGFDKSDDHQKLRWLCRCICGREIAYTTSYIKRRELDGIFACGSCIRRIDDEDLSRNLILHQFKHNAKQRGIPWKLSEVMALRLADGDCYFCGSKPCLASRSRNDRHRNKIKFHINGIDRLDSSKGYEEGNCVSCCKYCNALKSDIPLDTFLDHVRMIASHTIARSKA